MEVVPAIDISGGKCVRLFKGKKGTETVYFENPLDALTFWIKNGAERLHLVDLDGAWGTNNNKKLLKDMLKIASHKAKVQIGGGIRNFGTAIELIDLGADRIVIGTLAIKKPEIIKDLSRSIGSERIIVALDYKEGKISTHGWTQQTDISPFIFGKQIEKLGAGYILFSSVEADGAFTGPDFQNINKMVESVNIPVYAAGGVRNANDLKSLEKIGVHGVIVGKALYEKKIPLNIIKHSKVI